MVGDCVFCGIVAGALPSRKVMESERALAFLDINPAADGHTLVIPKAHATDIWELDRDDGAAVWDLTRGVADRIREVLAPDGLTLFQANRSAGWQDVFHLHVHVVPRWAGDRLTRPWRPTPADEGTLDLIAERLSPTGPRTGTP
jgi:histidine triad (HIT) family protein